MPLYFVFNKNEVKENKIRSGFNEKCACEIFAAMKIEGTKKINYVAVDSSESSNIFYILGGDPVGKIDIDSSHFLTWTNRYKDIYEAAFDLRNSIVNYKKAKILENSQILAALLIDAPELVEYALTNRKSAGRTLDELGDEAEAVVRISTELRKIFECSI